ncbi:MAG: hypothetical protein RLZZ447_623 [Verrucomicrobiota bacterium]|jgi:hypothetical protein
MTRVAARWTLIGVVALGLIALLRQFGRAPDPTLRPHGPVSDASASSGGTTDRPVPPARSPDEPVRTLTQQLSSLHGALGGGVSPAEAARLLDAAASQLRVSPRAAAVAALLAQLEARVDAATGLRFKVGPGGNLAAAPTFRVWLLDQLGQIDPSVGGSYAAQIYARRDSADEWALALRNDWRASASAGRIAPVRDRALELLHDPNWARQASPGFLEAFDLAVATLAWEAVPQLEQMLDPVRDAALRRAAWVALDRLSLEAPTDFLPTLAQRVDWLQSQPLVRAGLFARADLDDRREREAVEKYLARADVSTEEGTRFFELLPNVNATISHNLATAVRAPSLHQAARLDRAALSLLPAWRTRPEFARWNAAMLAAEQRIGEAVASAVRGGFSPP